MSTPRIRPQSSRERPVSGRSNRVNSSPTGERNRPFSAGATGGNRPSPANSTGARACRLNEPLLVNRLYLSDKSDLTPRIGSTMLPPSRYTTQYVDKDRDIRRYKKPPICPQSWIDENKGKRPPFSKMPPEMKRSLSESFVDRNDGKVEEYQLEFRGQSPRTIKEMIINSSEFGKTFSTLEHKQRAVGRGTSSFQLRSCLYEGNAEPVKTISTRDPYILSSHTSRSARDSRINQLFVSENKLHGGVDRKYVRGYRHIPEYGNFSAFSGHLVKNQGAILNR